MVDGNPLPGRMLLNQMTRMFAKVASPKFRADNAGHARASGGPVSVSDIQALASEAEIFLIPCKDAQPFLLPVNGDFGLEGKRSIMMGELRPPYPTTALEFTFAGPWAEEHNFAAGIVFLMDEWELENEFCMSILGAFLDRSGNWGWCDEIVRVKRGVTLEISGYDACEFSEPVYRQTLGLPEDHPAYRPLWAFMTRAAGDFLCLLSCTNVDIGDAPISEYMRRKDAEKKGGRFLVYKVLDLPNRTAGGGDGTGSHTSPRFHYRRGHIRRLATGKNVWVRMTTVGSMQNGLVAKDYRVGSPAQRESKP